MLFVDMGSPECGMGKTGLEKGRNGDGKCMY